MQKVIDVKLTSIFSPVCQALIYENSHNVLNESTRKLLDNNSELLVIRLDSTVIGYASVKSLEDDEQVLDAICFRSIIKDHALGEYWLTRLLKRHLKNNNDKPFLLAS